jgi:hypothetical protein
MGMPVRFSVRFWVVLVLWAICLWVVAASGWRFGQALYQGP